MKIINMKKVGLFILSVILIMGMTACALKINETETTNESKAVEEKSIATEIMNSEDTENSEADAVKTENLETGVAMEDEEGSAAEEIIDDFGCTIIAMVDSYEDNLIVLKDIDDEDIIYYFSTQNAEVIEGDSTIAAGDIVEITYQGVQGDKEHPGMAVKVVAESMIYN